MAVAGVEAWVMRVQPSTKPRAMSEHTSTLNQVAAGLLSAFAVLAVLGGAIKLAQRFCGMAPLLARNRRRRRSQQAQQATRTLVEIEMGTFDDEGEARLTDLLLPED